MKVTRTLITAVCITALSACGPNKEQIAKTCECEALNVKLKGAEGDYMLDEQISSDDAEKKAVADNKDAYDKCTQLHKDMGEANYAKAAATCTPK